MLPDVPTFAEAAFPSFVGSNWFGMAAPAGTPDDILDTLAQAIFKAPLWYKSASRLWVCWCLSCCASSLRQVSTRRLNFGTKRQNAGQSPSNESAVPAPSLDQGPRRETKRDAFK
jgi:hypothetical protein